MARKPIPPQKIDKKAVGRRIKTRRMALGMTMARLAQAEGVMATETTVCHWEAGRAIPRPWRLPFVAKHLEISVQELLWGDQVAPLPEAPVGLTEEMHLLWILIGSDLNGLDIKGRALDELRQSWLNALTQARRKGMVPVEAAEGPEAFADPIAIQPLCIEDEILMGEAVS